MRKTYAILAVIAAVVLAIYAILPDVLFVEHVFPMEQGTVLIGYDDSTDGGDSKANMVVGDSAISFDCTLGIDTSKGAWCGLLWNMDPDSAMNYRNWTFVDSVIFDVEANGTREVLVKIWTYDPDVTDITKPKTFRLLMKEMPLSEGRNHISIPMSHFYTPDFWFSDGHVDRKLNQRHQETVARIEIAPGWNQARGKKFSVKFFEIKAVGVSNIYFGIVLLIFLVITIIAVGRRHQSKNDVEEK